MVLFRCDQCRYEEWREASQEPWLCPVCGGMRWERVTTDEPEERSSGQAPGDDPESR
jgi:hypothetical protein